MSPDVIDLISSSPPRSAISTEPPRRTVFPSVSTGSSRRRSLKPRDSTPSPSRRLLGRCQTQPSSVRPCQTAQGFDEIDDFNDDLADSVFDLLDDWQAKRRRTHEEDGEDTCLRTAAPSISKSSLPLKVRDGRCRNTKAALEPIELTSPADWPSPSEKPVNISQPLSSLPSITADKTANPATAGQIAPLASDPFASSPLRPVNRRKAGTRASSVDILSSSSPLRTTSYRIRTTGDNRGMKCNRSNLPAKSSVDLTVEYNNITRRGAVPDGPTPKEAAWPTVSKDLISIDGSDSLSDISDELPAITDMDVSKRRARSPLRRSQSDLTSARPKTSHAPAVARKATTALAREAEKSRKRRERDEAKAIKVAEKQRIAALTEVNKLRTDKKVSAPEMIVDLPSGLGLELQVPTQELLQGLGVQYCTWNCPEHRIVKWRRKVTCKFNNDICLWEPVPLHIVDEGIAVLILTAEEFVAIARENSLADHVADIKTRYGDLNFMYILQGLTLWLRKNRSNRNRQFTSNVRSANEVALSSSSRARTEHVSEDLIEEALLGLQVEHGRLIHHTAVASETARWIINFTQHVSTIPYKKQRDQATSAAGFCMDSGQVRTGDSAQDTYVRMLQEIVRVTAPIAYGIATEFDSVTKLVDGLEQGGPTRLDAVRKSTNKDGAVSDRTIGQAISRRMHKVFTGRDEESTNV
ncbi:alpha-1,2-mannosyltransferase (Alg2) [Pochonia chlamydosporia 170]|uniref:Alpha-1,2-mannosyltransferase (Alg2) n=1 Tax=Pochonia chlamydosporia 170 TaxID=1380566 RepID=A0A179FX37_METCM|nr:alpha-1,2-mannosyltransferase (Alg2) [Pochonia chlamydosporia 170]OAQ69623.1 alpha-1,2-mannosyltransferase (Alg2) [Pochonia chlamydosporia 170]